MKYPWIVISLYFALVLSYAAWKGNAQPVKSMEWHNSKGEIIYPVVAKNMEQVAGLGSAQYYTGADGGHYTDIFAQEMLHFNWEAFFQVTTFGIAVALLLLLVIRLSTRLAKEDTKNNA